MNKKNQKAFTLLEMLVVISIIGILLALGVVAFSTAQRKSRDARRRADIKALQDGFEQYYADNGDYSTGTNCSAMKDDTDSFPGGDPLDPKTDVQYQCGAYGTAGYCVCADIEYSEGNATSNACAGYGTTTGGFFCLTNLQ